MMLSITGEADSCSVYSHGAGCPSSANAVPPAANATPATANPSKPLAHLALRHLHAARAPLINPQSIPPDGEECCTIRPLTNGLGTAL